MRSQFAELDNSLLRLVAAVVVVTSGLACDATNVPPDPDPEIWPMAVGNFWELEGEASGIRTVVRIDVIEEVELQTGEHGFVLQQSRNGAVDDDLFVIGANTSQGFVRLGQIKNPDTLLYRELQLPFPGVPGDLGTSSAIVADPDDLDPIVVDVNEITLVTVDTLATTQLGQLTCNVYRRLDKEDDVAFGFVIDEYYCPDHGLVRILVTRESNGNVVSDHLLTSSRIE